MITKGNVSLITCDYVIKNLTPSINANEDKMNLLNINNFKKPKAKSGLNKLLLSNFKLKVHSTTRTKVEVKKKLPVRKKRVFITSKFD